jgi:hypothetical protein
MNINSEWEEHMSVEISLIGYFLSAWLIHCGAITPSFLASADNPRGWKLSSLLVQVLTCVLFGPLIPQVAAMKQKCIDRSKIFV